MRFHLKHTLRVFDIPGLMVSNLKDPEVGKCIQSIVIRCRNANSFALAQLFKRVSNIRAPILFSHNHTPVTLTCCKDIVASTALLGS